jgi:hypothetical protein
MRVRAASTGGNIMDDPKHRDRRRAVRQEILDTEEYYVRCLEIVISEYCTPLTRDVKAYNVSTEMINTIFGNIQLLAGFHRLFLADLVSADFEMASAFVRNADFLKMYSDYLNKYMAVMTIINEQRTNRKFQDFLAKARQATGGMDLMSYLIMPVQRIPRYVLLLKELQKNTPEQHPTHETLLSALQKVEKIASHVNEQKRQVEDMSKLLEIQNKLTGASWSLLLPHRRLVREGTLKKIATTGKIYRSMSKKDVNVYVFNDVFLIANTNNAMKVREECVCVCVFMC